MTGLPLRLSSSHLLNFCTEAVRQGKHGRLLGVGQMREARVGKRLGAKLQS